MEIGGRHIGPGPYVIAEIGVNHDGSAERAMRLVRAAADAGADAIKLQLFETMRLLSRAARLAAYQETAGETDPIAMLQRLELTVEQMAGPVALAHELGLHAIVSIFTRELVDAAERLPWDAFKTASPDIINRPLLVRIAETGRPTIVSTGTATMDEVRCALGWLEPARGRLALLQCVSAYPPSDDSASLAGIADLQRLHDGPVGYSDHTTAVDTGALAVAAGAVILEKHITYDREAPGPDHAASLEPHAFAEYVALARRAARMLGAGKRPLDAERDVRASSRQSVVSAGPIPRGHVLTARDLTIKRPGTGVEPWRLEEVIGRRAARDIEADTPIIEEDLA